MANILITDPCFGKCSNATELLTREGHRVRVSPFPATEDKLIPLIKDVEAVIAGPDKISARAINFAKKLKIIARYGVGVDNIDLETATRNKVVVTNAAGANKHAVADYVFALMLALARKICKVDRSLKQGNWQIVQGADVWRKTLGVIGTGNIGRRVIQTARGFEMRTLAYDIHKDLSLIKQYGVRYVSLEELLRQSDFVTIHVPRTPETIGLIGAREFKLMKPSAYLINTARGGIVDEKALFIVLKEKKIAGAALDVFAEEPLKESPLFTLDNIITTSHIASSTEGAMKEVDSICVKNVLRVLSGKEPLNPVNKNTL